MDVIVLVYFSIQVKLLYHWIFLTVYGQTNIEKYREAAHKISKAGEQTYVLDLNIEMLSYIVPNLSGIIMPILILKSY